MRKAWLLSGALSLGLLTVGLPAAAVTTDGFAHWGQAPSTSNNQTGSSGQSTWTWTGGTSNTGSSTGSTSNTGVSRWFPGWSVGSGSQSGSGSTSQSGSTSKSGSGTQGGSTGGSTQCGWWSPCNMGGTGSAGGTSSGNSGSTGGSTTGTTSGDSLSGQALQELQLMNQARQQNGLVPLIPNAILDRLALEKANDLAQNYNTSYSHSGVLAHKSPTLGWPIDMERAAGFYASPMGAENWAMNRNAAFAFASFMNSPTHRANILNPSYRQVGIAVVPNIVNGQAAGVVVEELFAGN